MKRKFYVSVKNNSGKGYCVYLVVNSKIVERVLDSNGDDFNFEWNLPSSRVSSITKDDDVQFIASRMFFAQSERIPLKALNHEDNQHISVEVKERGVRKRNKPQTLVAEVNAILSKWEGSNLTHRNKLAKELIAFFEAKYKKDNSGIYTVKTPGFYQITTSGEPQKLNEPDFKERTKKMVDSAIKRMYDKINKALERGGGS